MKKNILSIFLFCVCSLILQAQNSDHVINKVHAGSINCMTVNFNASIAITGGGDSRVNIWDLQLGNKLKALQSDSTTDIVFNNDETWFATAGKNKTIVVCDAQTYRPKKILTAPAAVTGIAFHPFQNTLVSIATNGQVELWDALTGRTMNENLVRTDVTNAQNAGIKWSGDGKAIVIGLMDKLLLCTAEGTVTAKITATAGKQNKILFGLSPDAKSVAVRTGNNQITIANLQSGQTTTQISEDVTGLTNLQFAQNSNSLLLSYENGDVAVYNISDKKKTTLASLHSNIVKSVLSIDGNSLVVATSDLSVRKIDVSSKLLGIRQTPEVAGGKVNISQLRFTDENKNGLLDGGEKAGMDISLINTGSAPVYGVTIGLSINIAAGGVDFPAELLAGNLQQGATKSITVPFKVSPSIPSGSTIFKATAKSGKNIVSADSILLQTGSSSNAGVAVKSFQFYSPSGKASKNEPITLKVYIENITRIVAENVEVRFKFPAGIKPIDKTVENISKIPPEQQTPVSMQFIVDNSFKGDTIAFGLDIRGVSYSNSKQANIFAVLNKPISSLDDMNAIASAQSYKGGESGRSMVEEPGKPIEEGRFMALIIGINDYKGAWPKLANAVNDGKAVEEVLKNQYGFSTVHTIYDKDATRQKIISELEWLVANTTENDNLIIFYSGHGEYKEALSKGFWVPVDAQTNSTSYLISNSDLQTFLSSIPSKHTLLISDACFSGDIFRSGPVEKPAEYNKKYYSRIYNLKSRQAITSGGIEPVLDGGKDNHSVFTYYFLKALKDNSLKYFDSAQLFESIKIPVVNNSNQAPKFSPVKNTGDEGGEFVFQKK